MKYTDLKPDEIYVGYFGNTKFVFIPNRHEMWDKQYHATNSPRILNKIKGLANEEEKNHLLQCIEAKEYVEFK